MKRRYYSDAFIDRQITKIDETYEKCMGQNLLMIPDCLMPEPQYSYGNNKLSDREREQIKEYYRQLKDLSYVRGFWMGYSIREGIKDSE